MLEKIQQEPGKTQSNQGRKKKTNAKPRQTKPNRTYNRTEFESLLVMISQWALGDEDKDTPAPSKLCAPQPRPPANHFYLFIQKWAWLCPDATQVSPAHSLQSAGANRISERVQLPLNIGKRRCESWRKNNRQINALRGFLMSTKKNLKIKFMIKEPLTHLLQISFNQANRLFSKNLREDTENSQLPKVALTSSFRQSCKEPKGGNI